MRRFHSQQKQHGVVLAIGLLLLLAVTIIAIASMAGTHMQERMAGNARTQALAFEIASLGAADSVNYYIEKRTLTENSEPAGLPDLNCRTAGHLGWGPTPLEEITLEVADPGLRLFRSIACLAETNPSCGEGEIGCIDRPFRSQLLVLNEGRVEIGGQMVAQRAIEARIDYAIDPNLPNTPCPGICLPGCEYDSLTLADARQFIVDGGADGWPAVATGCESLADAFEQAAIEAGPTRQGGRLGNYIGGITESDIGPPWNNPDDIRLFAEWVKEQAQKETACDQGGGNDRDAPCYVDGPYSNTGPDGGGGNEWFGRQNPDDPTNPTAPRFTYIDGDASIAGSSKGAGVMVVDGNLDWAGTPDFHGIILVLGGSFTISGGGGGDTLGSIIVVNLDADQDDFGPVTIDVGGGGNHTIGFDCDLVDGLWNGMLGGLSSEWGANCASGDPSDPDLLGPPEPSLVSWRESLGWRREFWQAAYGPSN